MIKREICCTGIGTKNSHGLDLYYELKHFSDTYPDWHMVCFQVLDRESLFVFERVEEEGGNVPDLL